MADEFVQPVHVAARPSEAELQRLVSDAIWQTFDLDPAFLSDSASEVSAVGPIFARMYLKSMPGYRVDLEYDREGSDGDFKEGRRNSRNQWEGWKRPDVIIHRRGDNQFNLLVLEFKLSEDSTDDQTKIRQLLNAPKRYRYGATVILRHGDPGTAHWRWFSHELQDPTLEPVPRMP